MRRPALVEPLPALDPPADTPSGPAEVPEPSVKAPLPPALDPEVAAPLGSEVPGAGLGAPAHASIKQRMSNNAHYSAYKTNYRKGDKLQHLGDTNRRLCELTAVTGG